MAIRKIWYSILLKISILYSERNPLVKCAKYTRQLREIHAYISCRVTIGGKRSDYTRETKLG